MFLPKHTKCLPGAQVKLFQKRVVYFNFTVEGDLSQATQEINDQGAEFNNVAVDLPLAEMEAKAIATIAGIKAAYTKFASLDLFFTTQKELQDLADKKLWPLVTKWEADINKKVEDVRVREEGIRVAAAAIVDEATAKEKKDSSHEAMDNELRVCENNLTKAANLATAISTGLLNYNGSPPNSDQLDAFLSGREDSLNSLGSLIQPAVDITRGKIGGFEDRGIALAARAASLNASLATLRSAASNYRDRVIGDGKITDAAKIPLRNALEAFKKQYQPDGRLAAL